ncbi:hypothetical protein A0O34_16805 [Chryseobacterium glaciei]|uniref:HTH araC/xylS-type domain-containing protein n=1 Tax=Chryseobacterium glaciei TaxID=1685010 RepID=A0A172XYI8_9FLAO|nr:AraC family transcriptional regulator [Chryseobacterium glaciei]ANF52073.1 hypothetical protein A0O34_16805 [Chryseobacterium glaciei]
MNKILSLQFILIFEVCFSQTNAQSEINHDFIHLSLFASFLLSTYLFWKKSQKDFAKQVHEIVNSFDKKSYSDVIIENKEVNGNSNISSETLNVLLKKLAKFEKENKYLQKDITLTWLASYLNTNTKYLSETIRIHKEKNFNSYINQLRIKYITNKLYEDIQYREAKIVSLAKDCGYSSSQVFVIAFKKENGFSPSFFINNLNKN